MKRFYVCKYSELGATAGYFFRCRSLILLRQPALELQRAEVIVNLAKARPP